MSSLDSPADVAASFFFSSFFYVYAAACLSPRCYPLVEGTCSRRIPNGGILLAEQGGAPPRFHTQNVLASVMCSDDEGIGRGGPAPWTPYPQL